MIDTIQKLEHFWEFDQRGNSCIPEDGPSYRDCLDAGGNPKYNRSLRMPIIDHLKAVRKALDNSYPKLNRRFWWPAVYWEYLSIADQKPYVVVDASTGQISPFEVYVPTYPYVWPLQTLAELQAKITEVFGEADAPFTGGVNGPGHYAGLLPLTTTPNFSGSEALGSWQ